MVGGDLVVCQKFQETNGGKKGFKFFFPFGFSYLFRIRKKKIVGSVVLHGG